MAPYIISGLVVGSIYAISALGLVLTYTSSRVFNFAHGAIAYGIAIFYAYLTKQNGWSIEAAAPFTLLVVAPLLGLALYFALFRRLTHSSPTVRLVSTVGLWVALPALVRILFPFAGDEVFDAPGLVEQPADPNFLKVFGTYLNTNQFVVIVERGRDRRRRHPGAALHTGGPRHPRHRRPPAQRVDRGHQHRGGDRGVVDGRGDAGGLRRRAPGPDRRPGERSSSPSCLSVRSRQS